MGLSWWGTDGTHCGQDTVAEPLEVVSAEMLRRHLLALGATATFGAPIKGLGDRPQPSGYPDAARTAAMTARELWHPKNPYSDPDRVAALLELDRGRLDAAEQLAAASVRRWEGGISELGTAPTRASCWPPSTFAPVNRVGYSWPMARSPPALPDGPPGRRDTGLTGDSVVLDPVV